MTFSAAAPFVAVTEALRTLIRDKALIHDSDAAFEVSFNAPDKAYISELQSPGVINLYMYSFQENLERRHAETFPVVSHDGDNKVIGRKPRLVDVNYMISAWSRGASDNALVEQHLLSRVIQGIGRYDMLPPELIDEGYQPGPSGVSMKLMLDQDSKRTQGEFWSALGVAPKPVLNLELTVPIDVFAPVGVPVVTDIDRQLGRLEVPRDQWQQQPDEPNPALAGQIERNGPVPFSHLTVNARVFGTSDIWTTNPDLSGHWQFDTLPEGGYVVWVENTNTGTPTQQQEVQISKNDDGEFNPATVAFVVS